MRLLSAEAGGGGRASETEELRRAVALIFRRKAKDFLTDREFVFSASMDLRWFNYSDAMRLLETALRAGLVRREGKAVTPTFNHRSVELPPGFRPSASILTAGPSPMPETLLTRIADDIAKKSGRERPAVMAEINKRREELGLEPEIAALLIARASGVDIDPMLDEAERAIRDRIARRVEREPVGPKRDEEE
ncbi:MAG: DUF2240 family protein [Thermoplasmata archaeon]